MIDEAKAIEIVMQSDPTLSLEKPTRFNEIVRDVRRASAEPTFIRAKAVLSPYGELIPLLLAAVVQWKPTKEEKLYMAVYFHRYMVAFKNVNPGIFTQELTDTDLEHEASFFSSMVLFGGKK